jgi:non-ribosomal peptide synthetase component E (peptide arylation enzyme)
MTALVTQVITPEIRARMVSNGLWSDAPLFSFLDTAARRFPNKTAVSDPFHRLSYSELKSRTEWLAGYLLSLGVRPGDAVVVQAPNSVYLPLIHFACNRVQALYVPVHDAWREREITHLLRQSKASVAFAVTHYKGFQHLNMIEALRAWVPELKHVVPLELGTEGLKVLSEHCGVPGKEYARQLSNLPCDPDAGLHAMISSGTTALPKISPWSDNGLYALLMGGYNPTLKLTPNDVTVGIATASTGATGYVFGVLAPLLIGGTSILHDPWEPDAAVTLLSDEHATVAVAVPAQIIKMLESHRVEDSSFPKLRAFSNGGAPIPEAKARQVERDFGCRVHTMYGATDAGVPTMTRIDEVGDDRLTTVGQTVAGIELRIVGENGISLDTGLPGEITWRGPHKVIGYLNDDEATREAFDEDGWYYSGDLGAIDDHGFLRVVGRKKDMILRGGQNIFPGEIEGILSGHPKVSSVAVVAIPDSVLGERACAFVIVTDSAKPLSFDEMIIHLRAAGVAKFKYPERLEIVSEFPMTAGGKVRKADLPKLIQSEHSESLAQS